MTGFTSYVNWKDDSPLVTLAESAHVESKYGLDRSDLICGSPKTDTLDNLVQIGEEAKEPTYQGTEQDNRNKEGKEKLCGYLNKYKLGARGIRRQFKRRWFVYSENTCKLMYFRTPEDIVALGEIIIANATLSFEVREPNSGGGRNNVFEISSAGRIYYLEAADQQTMMYWLQQLQKKRRTFSRCITQVSVASDNSQLKTVQEPSAGLVAERSLPSIEQSQEICLPMLSVELPRHSVGEGCASSTSRRSHLSDISISNWKTELRNVFSNIRSKHTSDLIENVAATPGQLTPTTPQQEESHTKLSRFQSIKRKIRSKSQDMDSLGSSMSVSSESLCGRCKQLEGCISCHLEDVQFAEDELLATRELLRILQKDLDVALRKLKTQSSTLEGGPSTPYFEALHQKDQTIVELEHLVASVKEVREIDQVQFRILESKVESLEQDMSMYRDSLRTKDEVVMSLTKQVFQLENQDPASSKCKATNTTPQQPPVDSLEIERIRDALSGYRLQNTFLNKEILELNKLRADDEVRERQIFMVSKDWEAKYYQINSKYLLCLEELRQPQRGGDGSNQDLVTQLLTDVLEASVEKTTSEDLLTSQTLSYSISPRKKPNDYDKYGFLVSSPTGNDLVEKANSLQRISDGLRNMDLEREISQNVRWENVFASLRMRELHRTPELKSLIRKDGIPYQHKETVWNACISFQLGGLREKLGSQYYQNLLEQIEQQSHRHNPALKQIDLDLLRTLPYNKHYESMSSDGIPKLKRVLRAYSQHNPEDGYCQGQNRLAAIALLFLNEEDAFWCLLAITEYLMPPEYYNRTLSAAQVDQRVLRELMTEKLPHLSAHMEALGLDVCLFTFNWFLTVFIDNIPTETYLHVWDCFLYEGNKVLFRFALAFFKYREKEILAISDNMELNNYLRTFTEDMIDIDKISQIAFQDINPLAMRRIDTRRQAHMIQVKHELAELDVLRSQFRSSRKERPQKLAKTSEVMSDDEI